MAGIVQAGAAIVLGNAAAASDGRPVLPGITLTVRAGERVALMGRSGAGESTLIGLIHGQAPDRMALVPQAARVRPPPVFHNVHMGRCDRRSPLYNLRRRIRPARADIAAVEAVLDRVGLANRLRAKAGELSGGQRQRVSVVGAFSNGRPVLVGDEAGLRARPPAGPPDPHRAGPQPRAPLILARHDVALALAQADRIVVLEAGRTVPDAPAQDLDAARLQPFSAIASAGCFGIASGPGAAALAHLLGLEGVEIAGQAPAHRRIGALHPQRRRQGPDGQAQQEGLGRQGRLPLGAGRQQAGPRLRADQDRDRGHDDDPR